MEASLTLIESLVKEIKKEMSSSSISTISPSTSAYETAWLAMIPEEDSEEIRIKKPEFKGCLNWVLHNQNDQGFWGEEEDIINDGHPTIDAIPATLACILALKFWGIGDDNINRGLKFINSSIDIILKKKQRYNHLPHGFVLLFPSMLEHAQNAGLEFSFTNDQHTIIEDIFLERQQILDSKCIIGQNECRPFFPYLEYDEFFYKSPSAIARAFLATGDQRCLKYLRSLVQNFPNGVPPMYPMDEDLVKLCAVDQIQRLGLAEYFVEEIEQILSIAHRNYVEINKSHIEKKNDNFLPLRLYKDSLAFRLLRLHGYDVNPGKFCWFLDDDQVIAKIEKESSHFLSAILNIYKATDLMFSRESDKLGVVRSFSRKILEKNISLQENVNDLVVILPNFLKMVEHELNMPWMARLDHLDHRFWIEESKSHPLWVGKSSFYRLPWLHDEKLFRLAEENYMFRQAIYRKELEEVEKWCKTSGLSTLSFGREKTTYLYFTVASSAPFLPHDSIVRIIVTKMSVLITYADDFFDIKGSLHELQCLNDAVNIWDGEGLNGFGKIIFDVLDNLVNDISEEYYHRYKSDILEGIRDLWRETFDSWMVETSWSKNDYVPTTTECLKVGMISIAVHTVVLIASCFINPRIPEHKLKPSEYEEITKLLMATTRMLNDTQSYQKEKLAGKNNLVLLHLKENPNADIKYIVGNIKEIVEKKKRLLVELALIDGLNDLPKSSNYLHLQCLNVFQMLYSYSSNRFDTETELVPYIEKAIFVPPNHHVLMPMKGNEKSIPVLPDPSSKSDKKLTISCRAFDANLVIGLPRMLTKPRFIKATSKSAFKEGYVVLPNFKICFI